MERSRDGYERCTPFSLYVVRFCLNHFSLSLEQNDTQSRCTCVWLKVQS